jgi:hypothetical protein
MSSQQLLKLFLVTYKLFPGSCNLFCGSFVVLKNISGYRFSYLFLESATGMQCFLTVSAASLTNHSNLDELACPDLPYAALFG